MENIFTFFAPIVLSLITQGVKKVEMIPINAGQKARIRTFVGVGAFILALTEAYLNGTLSSSPLLPILGDTIVNYVGASVTYLILKAKNTNV